MPYFIQKNWVVEWCLWLITCALLIFLMRSNLIYGESTFSHDNLGGPYPIFHMYVQSLVNGGLPLWNPFTQSGTPLYPAIMLIRLLDPLAPIVVLIGQLFTKDIVLLFNWYRFVQGIVAVVGMYLVLGFFTKYRLTKLSLVPILLLSSTMLGSFRQDGIINQFLWSPYIIYFSIRILAFQDRRWFNWLFLGAFIGLNWQAYWFTGASVFLLFLVIGFALFKFPLVSRLIKAKGFGIRLSLLVVIIGSMLLPNLVLLQNSGDFSFPLRTATHEKGSPYQGEAVLHEGVPSAIPQSVDMDYEGISETGTFLNFWNFVQLIVPDGNLVIHRFTYPFVWGSPSEAYLYLGLLPWLLMLWGVVRGRHQLKAVWLFCLLGMALLLLGPVGGVHRLLYPIFPPLWFVRNLHCMVMFVELCLLYFYVIGLNHVLKKIRWGDIAQVA